MKFFIFNLFIFIASSFYAQNFEQYFTEGVLRFDYYHIGNAESEWISEDQLFEEPFWGGSKVNLIDTFDFGNYKFEVYDSSSNELIYSRGYSTLFSEWRHTAEANEITEKFSETIRFPFPKSTVNVKFYNRTWEQTWELSYQAYVDPNSDWIVHARSVITDNEKIHGKRCPEEALDVVFIAEGYTVKEQRKFIKDTKRFKKYLLESDLFKEVPDEINIWIIPTISQESGTDDPNQGIWKSTVFDAHFNTFGTDRYLNTIQNKKIRDFASNVPYDQIYLLVNSEKYGGAGIFNTYSICTVDNKQSEFVFVHEFGHAFAGLADEYYTSDVVVTGMYNFEAEPWEANITTLVDFDSKWKDMLDSSTPIPTPIEKGQEELIGVFEGGGYSASGIYRPRLDCSMKSARNNYYCPVCTKAFGDMLEFYVK